MRLPRAIEELTERLRHDLPRKLPWLDRRVVAGSLAFVVGAVLVWAISAGPLSGDDSPQVETRVVTIAVETDDAAGAPVGPLGFPQLATRNTTRVGGPDPASDAAAIALATHPRSSLAGPVEAAVLVDGSSAYAGIAASVLAGPPIRAPILIGGPGGLPQPTTDALAKLDPQAGAGPADVAVYRIGDVASPPELQAEQVGTGSAAEVASAVDELRARLFRTDPAHIVVASSEQPAYAMPAAAWAARSGDPVLFSGRTEVPEATIKALQRHRGTPVYVLGPPSVVSEQAVRQIERISPGVQRVGAEGAVANSIAFARYADADFGWNINDPGHGLVVANASRPLDAAAASALSASGKWGPLLVIEDPGSMPAELRSFLLDIKPGFQDDPTRALYNHIWLIGDATAIGARVQAEADELAELAEVGPGAGGAAGQAPAGANSGIAQPAGPEAEPPPRPAGQGKGGAGGNP